MALEWRLVALLNSEAFRSTPLRKDRGAPILARLRFGAGGLVDREEFWEVWKGDTRVAVKGSKCGLICNIGGYHQRSGIVQFRFDNGGDGVVLQKDDIPIDAHIHGVVLGDLPIHILARGRHGIFGGLPDDRVEPFQAGWIVRLGNKDDLIQEAMVVDQVFLCHC